MIIEKYINYFSIKKYISIVELLVVLEIDSSYSNIKRIIHQKALQLNGNLIDDINYIVSESDIINTKMVIKIGKKNIFVITIA